MKDEEYRQIRASNLKGLLERAYDMGFDDGRAVGFVKGMEAGYIIGRVEVVDEFKSAISDGLRRGSSKCAKIMNNLK